MRSDFGLVSVVEILHVEKKGNKVSVVSFNISQNAYESFEKKNGL